MSKGIDALTRALPSVRWCRLSNLSSSPSPPLPHVVRPCAWLRCLLQAPALAAVAVKSVRRKLPHFSVGECGGLIVSKGIVGKILNPWKNGGNRIVKNGYFVPFWSHFPQPHAATTLNNSHSWCYARNPPPPPFPPIFLHFPPFPPIFLHFPHFPYVIDSEILVA